MPISALSRRAGLNRKACQMDLANVSVKASIDSHRKKMGLFNKVYERLTRELEEEDQAKAGVQVFNVLRTESTVMKINI